MIGGAERIDVKSAVIGEHPQVIIAPPDHPLAKQRSISPREIATQTILMREVGSGTRLLAKRFLAQHGIEPRIGMEIGSNETIKQAVMARLGIGFISAHTIAAEIDDGRLAILDVAGLPEIRQWFVVHPATKRMMPAASSLRDFLVAEGRRFLPNLKHGRRGGKPLGFKTNRSVPAAEIPLIGPCNFPVFCKKFPAPTSRELGSKARGHWTKGDLPARK